MDNELFKIRSVGGCVKAAYDLFVTNLKTILRRTWMPAVVFALFYGVLALVMRYVDGLPQFETFGEMFAAYGVLFVSVLLLVGAEAFFNNGIVSLLNGLAPRKNLPRVLRQTLLMVGVYLLALLLTFGLAMIPFATAGPNGLVKATYVSGIVNMVMLVVIAIASIPFAYSTMRYFMQPELRVFSIIGGGYGRGWRHWGYLFLLFLVGGIILLVISMVVSLPQIVLLMAGQNDAFGQQLGDAPALPSSYTLLLFISAFVSGFIMLYASTWMEMALYYAYGHFEAKAQAKQQEQLMVQEGSLVAQKS